MPRRFQWLRLRPSTPAARRRPTVRLGVEALERRDVPAGYSVNVGYTYVHGGVEGKVDADETVFAFDATDPNGHTVTSVSGFSATIDPGDKTPPEDTQVSIVPDSTHRHLGYVHMSHLYTESNVWEVAGDYTVTVFLKDPLGKVWTAKNAQLGISDAPITANGTNLKLTTNDLAEKVVALIHDSNRYAPPTDFVYGNGGGVLVSYGDGSAMEPATDIQQVGPGEFVVCGEHRYTHADDYTINVYIGDRDTIPQHYNNEIVSTTVTVTDPVAGSGTSGGAGVWTPPQQINSALGFLNDLVDAIKGGFSDTGVDTEKFRGRLGLMGQLLTTAQVVVDLTPLASAINGPRQQFLDAASKSARGVAQVTGSVAASALLGAGGELLGPWTAVAAGYLGGKAGDWAGGAAYDKLDPWFREQFGHFYDWAHGGGGPNRLTLGLSTDSPCAPGGGPKITGPVDIPPQAGPPDTAGGSSDPFHLRAEIDGTQLPPDGRDPKQPGIGDDIDIYHPPANWNINIAPIVPFPGDPDDPGLVATSLPVRATENQVWLGPLADFRRTNNTGKAGDFLTWIGWGDGTVSAGNLVSDGNHGFVVTGSHPYHGHGPGTVSVLIQDSGTGKQLLTLAALRVDVAVPTSGPATPDQAFVGAAYENLLGRPVDPAGLAAWAGSLDQGASLPSVSHGLVNSTEFRAGLVKGFYELLLHREPAPAEVNAWVGSLNAGATAEQAEAGLLGSAEYRQNRGGGTADGFITALFGDVLNRAPAAGGRALLRSELAAGTPAAAVATQMLSTDEFRADEVKAAYESVLHRPADAAGMAWGLGYLRAGGSLTEIEAALVGTIEFANSAGGDQNQEFVQRLYHDVLGRDADPSGLGFYTGLLDGGQATRAQVAQALAGSPEAARLKVQAWYQYYLGRAADPSGLGAYSAALGQGFSDEQVRAALLGSGEYYARAGGTDDAFVRALYRDALGRDADAGGLAHFEQYLAGGGSRGAVALALTRSPEGEGRVVGGLYLRLLRRSADAWGLGIYAGLLSQGAVTDEQVVADLASSPEYFALV